MTAFLLIRKNLTRQKVRTLFSVLAICVAFGIFGVLKAFSAGALSTPAASEGDRVIVSNKVSFTQPLPASYEARLRSLDGVTALTHRTWFGGYYRQIQNFIVTYAVEANTYFDVYRDTGVAPEAVKAFQQRRDAALVGTAVAARYNLKVGDRLALYSNAHSRAEGGNNWNFEIVGLIPSARQQAQNTILINYDYFNSSRAFGQDTVSQFIIAPGGGKTAALIAAADAQTANSAAETNSMTEAAFNQAFASQFADVSMIVTLVTSAALASILFIVGSTMVMAIRERVREFAVLISIGFNRWKIGLHVLGETLVMSLLGGGAGMTAANLLLNMAKGASGGQLDHFTIGTGAWVEALGLSIGLGIAVAAIPIAFTMTLNVPTALRRS